MSALVQNLLMVGWVVVILLVVLAFVRVWRQTNGGRTTPRTPNDGRGSSTPDTYPYFRGTDLYRRSLAHRNDTVQVRIAMGLPPQHNEPMWRDPPR